MIIDESPTQEFRKIDAGSYLGRCFSVIDLGHQTVSFIENGQPAQKQQRKVLVSFELFGDDSNGPLEIDGKPMVINKKYTFSMNEAAKLRLDIESWKGKKLVKGVDLPFDMKSMLDKWAMVNVVHNDWNGKTYANLNSLSQVPSMIVKAGFPKTFNENVLFDLNKYTKESFEKLWPWVQDIIKKSAEWSNSVDHNPLVDDPDIPF
jgi:hypothetical protein